MTMRAYVERNTASTKDGYGGPVAPVWTAQADPLPCWAWSQKEDRIADGQKNTRREELRCAFPVDADVTQTDRLARIENRSGTLLHAGPLNIMTLVRRPRHLEATLESVQ